MKILIYIFIIFVFVMICMPFFVRSWLKYKKSKEIGEEERMKFQTEFALMMKKDKKPSIKKNKPISEKKSKNSK